MKIGILALQGDFAAHIEACERLDGVRAVEIRRARELEGVDGIIIPGGESTTMFRLLEVLEMEAPLREWLARGKPVFGTCAGAILLAQRILSPEREGLGAIDMSIERNSYGRQIDSFIAPARRAADGLEGLECVFIRAPRIRELGSGVEVLAEVDGDPVLVRQGPSLAATFHPELSRDGRVHRYFAGLVTAAHAPRAARAAL